MSIADEDDGSKEGFMKGVKQLVSLFRLGSMLTISFGLRGTSNSLRCRMINETRRMKQGACLSFRSSKALPPANILL